MNNAIQSIDLNSSNTFNPQNHQFLYMQFAIQYFVESLTCTIPLVAGPNLKSPIQQNNATVFNVYVYTHRNDTDNHPRITDKAQLQRFERGPQWRACIHFHPTSARRVLPFSLPVAAIPCAWFLRRKQGA